MNRSVIVSLAVLSLAGSASADSDRWMRLGQADLDPRANRVELSLRGRQRIEALVLGVDNTSLRILSARIQLANGRLVNWPIRGVLYPRERSRVFALPGPFEHRVRKVVLYYETGHSRRRIRRDDDRPWERDLGPRDRDRESGGDLRWRRDWDPSWERSYGRLRPHVVVWGRD